MKRIMVKTGVSLLFWVIIIGAGRMYSGSVLGIAEDGHLFLALVLSLIASIILVWILALYSRIMSDI